MGSIPTWLANIMIIHKQDLIIGKTYICDARNFTKGRWNGETFEYMRYKFGHTYGDTDDHWDDGGTVKPIKILQL